MILPIPGTSSPTHVEENIAAAGLRLSDQEFRELLTVKRQFTTR
jgi:aryl-alcohol dehydrogenase-like predicted oxidoreductase